jgi:hypothetical protein
MKRILVAVVLVTALFAARNANAQDVDIEKVKIPEIKSTTKWFDCVAFSIFDERKEIEFKDGKKGFIYRDTSGQNKNYYWIDTPAAYKTEKDAIDALYVYLKYGKVRKTGKK